MNQKSVLRRRIVKATPLALTFDDGNGGTVTEHFRIAFDLNSMVLFEEETGLNMFKEIGSVLSTASVTIITALFWAGIQMYHMDYRGEEGLEIIRTNLTLLHFGPILQACVQAFLEQLPKEQQAKIKADTEAREAGQEVPQAPLAQPDAASTK